VTGPTDRFGPDWTTPPPPRVPFPPGARPPIRGRRVALGVALAIAGHLLTVGIAVLFVRSGGAGAAWLSAGLIAQALLFIACLVIGIVLISRGDRGLGIGLIIGWAVGVIVIPVVGFGACILLISSSGLG
jgi:hypothetical protein